MLGKTRFPAVRGGPYQLALAPFGFYWFQLERLDL
jgi:maltose alpha-D-glucosyltransferase/alpha-amylase